MTSTATRLSRASSRKIDDGTGTGHGWEGKQIVFGPDLLLEACHDIMRALPDEWVEPERRLMASNLKGGRWPL